MLKDRIIKLANDQVDFVNDELEAMVEALNAANTSLIEAAIDFEDAAAGVEGGLEIVADGIVSLANEFGKAFPALSAEQQATVKSAFAAIFTSTTPDQETAGENLFDATLDYIVAAKSLNAFVDSL